MNLLFTGQIEYQISDGDEIDRLTPLIKRDQFLFKDFIFVNCKLIQGHED